VKIRQKELPMTAILGLLATSAIWLVVILTQPYSRWAGIIWMAAGVAIYYAYRRRHHLPLTHVQEQTPRYISEASKR
jgi:membrane protease YdiL (CAAX protease family)